MASLTTGRRGWARGVPNAESWDAGHTGCLVKPLTERTQPPALALAGLSREDAETDPQAPAPECPTALGLSWALAQLRHPVKPRQCAVGANSPPGARAEMQHHLTPFSHPIPGPLAGHWSRPGLLTMVQPCPCGLLWGTPLPSSPGFCPHPVCPPSSIRPSLSPAQKPPVTSLSMPC